MSQASFVLVVDPDLATREWIEVRLRRDGHAVAGAGDGAAALRELEKRTPSVVVLELALPDVAGIELLRTLRATRPGLPVIVVSAAESVDAAVDCMRLGASDFVQKPIDRERLVRSVRNARDRERLAPHVAGQADATDGPGFAAIAGRSPAIARAVALLRRVAASDVTVLLLGETGTGKEIAARALHAESRRASGPFVAVNCGAIPESLVESVLFGHERGSFTGADETRPGLFERGHRGTVLLDEVGELPHPMQVKLLRVLQDRCVQRIGAAAERSVDVRVIAATNRDLHADVERGRVRQDLYYRLAVFPVTMPPLRERGTDVLLIAERTLARLCEAQGRGFVGFTDEAKQALAAWRWPGNVRELQNVVERATLLESGPVIRLASLSDEIVAQSFTNQGDGFTPHEAIDDGVVRPLEEEERRIVERALRLLDWNIQETAARLGIGRATLYRRMHAWGLARPGEVPALTGDGD